MQQPLNVAIIGAGFSGVGAAIRLLEQGITNFRLFDKASGVGGTWYHTTYPGAACDVSSHLYCYSFEPNPNWSRVYSPQEEIRAYIEHCVDKYNVSPSLRLGTEVVSIEFDEVSSHWKLHFADASSVCAHQVIVATGGLHHPMYPNIPGMNQFRGDAMHTARWDDHVDLKDKKVAVIGSAASAIQIVPEVAKIARHLSVFQRTPNWILPRNDGDYSPKEKSRFARWGWFQRLYRHYIFARSELVNFQIVKTKDDNLVRRKGEALVKNYIRSTVDDTSLHERLIPNYPMGCKRVLLSDHFYQTLNLEHVALTTSAIDHIDSSGITTADNRHHTADVIIYATGYNLDTWLDKIPIIGPGGISLKKRWKDLPAAYRGTFVPGFPNLFMVTGPNTGVGSTSILYMIEAALELIMQCIEIAGNDQLMSVTEQAHTDYNKHIQRDLRETVWAASCNSWYKRPSGEIPTLYPYSARTFKWQHRKLNLKHFEIVPAIRSVAFTKSNADGKH
ncbi:MAG: NAD(P)-binding domain-containing protein [Verrucomicrobiaceae bacterium]|nr:NAD(P)-binding domain-containing protein [Verrucomicrobiaceae bacterium]